VDWLQGVFLGAFVFGVLFTLVSVLLGLGHGVLDGLHLPIGHGGLHGEFHGGNLGGHLGGHGGGAGLEAGHAGPGLHSGDAASLGHGQAGPAGAGEHAGAGQQNGAQGLKVSPWNLTALTAFIAWFGGVGYLALAAGGLAAGVSVLLAIVAGLIGWSAVQWFYARVLLPAEHPMVAADYELIGTVARVSTPIQPGRIGEIQFLKGGTRRSEGARALDSRALARGAEVVIARYERGLAYVQPWEEFVADEAPAPQNGAAHEPGEQVSPGNVESSPTRREPAEKEHQS
jgi:hypothetical protein